ncbi:hypothetical protein [Methylorubrum suomiense]|uniref:Uncharacterized protein n=1 Tax=Methylorubrum suomiense TaxID=144191 RepID=A0ABQ4V0F4_9HYPH|nr:hypothetical protein [Methylorubrum suomiense]GJE77750.1 hypothetical protein BGCPKDLD_4357 [Methylorubrum suomiense]
MNSFAEVIDRLGIGPTAAALGLKDSHVRTLKARDSIPPTYFGALVESEDGKKHGLTYELLHRLHQEAVARRARPTDASEARSVA